MKTRLIGILVVTMVLAASLAAPASAATSASGAYEVAAARNQAGGTCDGAWYAEDGWVNTCWPGAAPVACNERGTTWTKYGPRYAYSHEDITMARSWYGALGQSLNVGTLTASGIGYPEAVVLLMGVKTYGWLLGSKDQGCGVYVYGISGGWWIESQG